MQGSFAVACPRETGFRPRADLIEAAITPNTKAIVFANPNNPTGAVFTVEELEAIADIASRHDLWIIADEVYAGQVYRGHPPLYRCVGREWLSEPSPAAASQRRWR